MVCVASAEQLSERADVINVVRQLLERQAELWALPAELLHEAYIHLAHSAPALLDSLLLRRAESVHLTTSYLTTSLPHYRTNSLPHYFTTFSLY